MKRLPGKPAIYAMSMPLLAAMLWAIPSTSQASILLPEQVPFDLEQLAADADSDSAFSDSTGTSAGAASSSTSEDSSGHQAATPDIRLLLEPTEPDQAGLLQTSTSPGGSSTGTSSSSSGSSGSSVSPLASSAAANLSDAELVAWISSEQRFSLPTPPGNELLRPPQVCRS